jgi:hypothetical protein
MCQLWVLENGLHAACGIKQLSAQSLRQSLQQSQQEFQLVHPGPFKPTADSSSGPTAKLRKVLKTDEPRLSQADRRFDSLQQPHDPLWREVGVIVVNRSGRFTLFSCHNDFSLGTF